MGHGGGVTTNSFKDSQLLADLLDQVEGEVRKVSADGAYDSRNCYDAIPGERRERRSRRRSGAHLAAWQYEG